MTLLEKIQAKTTLYTILDREYVKGQGHVWTVRNNETGVVSKRNTYELTNGRDTAAHGYRNRTSRRVKSTAKSLSHGMSNTKFYHQWKQMKNRCNNPSQPQYEKYHAKGYAPEWETFEGFYADMYDTYQDGLTIDRIDGNLGYFPWNCRWADRTTQQRNMKSNVRINWFGNEMTLVELVEKHGLTNYGMCNQDLRRYQSMGFSLDMAAVMMILGFTSGVRLLKGNPKAKTVKAGKELCGDVYGSLSSPLNSNNLTEVCRAQEFNSNGIVSMCRTSEIVSMEAL